MTDLSASGAKTISPLTAPNSLKAPSTLVVGLALFSMFFGSGNLIFPLVLGAKYQNYFYWCALGFVITAVILPTLGLLAMIPARGHYEKLFSGLISPTISKWFFLAVLIFWIPLGSGPRCVVLAHASISTYLISPLPLWLFSLLFLVLVYICLLKRSYLIDILGKILTPILLISILAIVISSLSIGRFDSSEFAASEVFLTSLVDGYYTQDLIAAIFFSSALVTMLTSSIPDPKIVMRKTWTGGLIAVTLLALLYGALMAASAIHGEHLAELSGDRLVSALALLALGETWGGLSSVAVSLACFTTEIALVIVFADFLGKYLKAQHSKLALPLTLLIIFFMSLLKFDGIMAIVAPAMKLIYPILFLLVLRLLWRARSSILP